MDNPKQQCLEDLQARILRLDYLPGAEMDEMRIAARYGLSRTPLREVFRTLAGEGYLTLEHNRGARVAPLDTARLRAFFRTAPMVLTATARLAAETRRNADIAALEEAQSSLQDTIARGQATDAALADHNFQAQVGAMAANPYLSPSLTCVLIDLTRLCPAFFEPASKKDKKALKRAVKHHDVLIAAIVARDGDKAAAAATQRWQLSLDHITQSLHADPLQYATAPEAPPV